MLPFSCKYQSTDEFVNAFDHTPKFELKSEQIDLVKCSTFLSYLFEMEYSDSVLIVNEFPDPKYCLKIIDLRTKKVRNFAKKGKGPNEIQAQACDFKIDRKSRNLMISDHKCYYTYPIDSLLNQHDIPVSSFNCQPEKVSFLKTVYCNGKITGNAIENRFALYNIYTKQSIGKCNYRTGPLVDQANFYPHPSKDVIAFFQSKAAIMGIIQVEDQDLTIKENCFWESEDKEVISRKTRYSVQKKGARNGFITASVSENYVYVLYSGKIFNHRSEESLSNAFFSEFVYVFDWNGNPIKHYKLDQEVRSIAIDEENGTLYAASYSGGEPHIIKYQLKSHAK